MLRFSISYHLDVTGRSANDQQQRDIDIRKKDSSHGEKKNAFELKSGKCILCRVTRLLRYVYTF
jgi:hypothetical protein